MIHLIKLSVGPQTLADRAARQTDYLKERELQGQTPELIHVTRHKPKRAEVLLEGGSIYWVIKGLICARQRLLALRPQIVDFPINSILILQKSRT